MQLSNFFELFRFYYRLVVLLFVTIVGGAVGFSLFFLFVSPIYTATSTVSLLPTQAELAYSQNAVRSSSINPANLLTQTHIEYLTSREVARLAVDRLSAEAQQAGDQTDQAPQEEAASGLKDQLASRFRGFRREFRRIYNILNSGRHVPLDPYTDAVLGLQDAIVIEMVEGTYILQIEVKWATPEGATAAANVLAEVYLERAKSDAAAASKELERELLEEMARGEGNFGSLEQQINNLRLARAANLNFLRVIDPATVPLYPSFPKVVINTVFAIVGWLFVTAFALIAIDTYSRTLKTKSEAKRVFDGRFLGVIRLKKQRSWQRKHASDVIRLMSNGRLSSGAVMSVGSDEESAGLHKFIGEALVSRFSYGSPPFKPTRKTEEGTAGEDAVSVPDVLQLTPEQAQYPDRKFRDYGGVAGSFRASDINKNSDWVVVGMRAGKITEPDLQSLIEELKSQGVRHVFGVFVKGKP